MQEINNLKGMLLIAMPTLKDETFGHSVIYICEHNKDGAMGLILNATLDGLTLGEVLSSVQDLCREEITLTHLTQQISYGGPVQQERGFVLHTGKKKWLSSTKLDKNLTLTVSKDLLQILGTSLEPKQYRVFLGYSGWEAGQLEQEIAENSWLLVPLDADLIFNTPAEDLWEIAVSKLGINSCQLSHQTGYA